MRYPPGLARVSLSPARPDRSSGIELGSFPAIVPPGGFVRSWSGFDLGSFLRENRVFWVAKAVFWVRFAIFFFLVQASARMSNDE